MKECYEFSLFHLASQDYIASNQTLTFTTPERKCIRIEIVDDSELERNEQFWVYVTLPTDTGRQVLSRCGSIQITDNDGKKEMSLQMSISCCFTMQARTCEACNQMVLCHLPYMTYTEWLHATRNQVRFQLPCML